MESNSLKIAHLTYIYEDSNWIALCDEVGLAGYQGENLAEVKKLVAEGLELFFDGQPFQIQEEVVTDIEIYQSR